MSFFAEFFKMTDSLGNFIEIYVPIQSLINDMLNVKLLKRNSNEKRESVNLIP